MYTSIYMYMYVCWYCKSGNFRCKNIFMVDRSYENYVCACVNAVRGRSYENIFTRKFFQRKFHYAKISGFTVLLATIEHTLPEKRPRESCSWITQSRRFYECQNTTQYHNTSWRYYTLYCGQQLHTLIQPDSRSFIDSISHGGFNTCTGTVRPRPLH